MLTTPKFWQKKGFVSVILLPLSVIYYLLYKIYNLKYLFVKQAYFSAKVICVGNIVAGGSGKTPTCIAISQILMNKSKKVAFITKGYKRKLKQSIKVNSKHKANEVGDEALILAKQAPTYVSSKRKNAINMAIADGAQVVILDDGLHDESIKKDYSILLVDKNYGFGNGLLLPAGPKRARLKDYTFNEKLIIGENAKSQITLPENFDTTKNYIALCGIANPQRFFNSLKQFNLTVKKEICFPDHHNFTQKDAKNINAICKLHNAHIICTEKDYVKLKNFNILNNIFYPNYKIILESKKLLKYLNSL